MGTYEPRTSLADIRASGSLDGYREGAPNAEVAALDRDACATAACERCGHVGLQYRPFIKRRSYRFFAVCPPCGLAEEA